MNIHTDCLHPFAARGMRSALLALLFLPALALAQSPPTFGPSPCGEVAIAPMISIPVGKSTLIRSQTPVSRILLGNPEQAQAGQPTEGGARENGRGGADDTGRPGVAQVDVLLLSPTEIYLLGKTVGSTNVVLVDRAGRCTALDVAVAMDVTAVESVLARLMPGEKDISVSAAYDSLVLSGTVTDAAKVDRAVELANMYVRQGGGRDSDSLRVVNLLQVGAPQQVMLEVKVAEVSKALLDRFGIDFTRAVISGDDRTMRFLSGIFGGRGLVAGQVSGVEDAATAGAIAGALTNDTTAGAVAGDAAGDRSTLLGIDAQKTDGLVRILAEPTVMAISGKEGAFLAGGNIFIPVAQDSGDGGRTITLEEKEFGVSVRFTPTVLEGGRINLQVAPEVSELNREGVGISAPGVSGLAVLPSFTLRRASTTVQLHDGQSFAIGGLIRNNATANIRAFPFLGEVPILGALFRSTDFQNDRSELVFVVTPRLVRPLPASYALPTDTHIAPTRADVFLGGRLEGRPSQPGGVVPAAALAPADASRGGFEPIN